MSLVLRIVIILMVVLASGAAFSQEQVLMGTPDQPLRLAVDMSDRELRAFIGEQEVANYTVAVGKDKNPTPRGTFTIRKTIWNPAWVPPNEKRAKGKTPKAPGHPENPMKRVKMFFKEPDYYIHGTGDDDSLGTAASHGCLRMNEEQVTELAKLVMERGGQPQPEPWYRRILHSRKTKVVYLKQPIQIQIVE
jgi:lipoprotein-anchoring transpeptidase ErfK/SrfK